ncbi:LOW QUALITY PROTEIN: hypothetical protein MAR_011151, partial [Mya arenaria]
YFQSEKECSLKKLTAIQNDPNQKSPDQLMPETPVPDYEEAATPENQNVFTFAKKFQKILTNIQKIEDMYSEQEEPEPDYHDEADSALQDEPVRGRAERSSSQSSENGQTGSRKPQNPCIESPTRMALHKELLLNYKRGVNVLEKPELNKVLQNRRETQRRKEWDDQKKMSTKRTSFEMKLEERANRMKEDEMSAINEEPTKDQPEFQKIFTKIKSKSNGAVNFIVADPTILSWIEKKSDEYTPPVQNEIIQTMALDILRMIVSSVLDCAFFPIMVYETTDISDREQVVLVLRHLNVQEDYIELYFVSSIAAQTITNVIKGTLQRMRLQLFMCLGQCYDGASNIGQAQSAGSLQTSPQNNQGPSIHTALYMLLTWQLVIQYKAVLRDSLDLVREISKLVKFSPKLDEHFVELRKEMSPDTPGFRVLCPTRWT